MGFGSRRQASRRAGEQASRRAGEQGSRGAGDEPHTCMMKSVMKIISMTRLTTNQGCHGCLDAGMKATSYGVQIAVNMSANAVMASHLVMNFDVLGSIKNLGVASAFFSSDLLMKLVSVRFFTSGFGRTRGSMAG